jgi:hypothetical protein
MHVVCMTRSHETVKNARLRCPETDKRRPIALLCYIALMVFAIETLWTVWGSFHMLLRLDVCGVCSAGPPLPSCFSSIFMQMHVC